MKTGLPISRLYGPLLLMCGTLLLPTARPVIGQEPPPEESVTVELASGRSFTARLDPRTDASRLWLRAQRGLATVERPIRWERVVRATVAGQDLSGEQFQQIVQRVRRDLPAQDDRALKPRVITITGSPEPIETGPTSASGPDRDTVPPRVRSLAIEAVVANWDNDVEVDGLLVRVYPLGDYGELVSVGGTLQVDLTSRRYTPARGARSFSEMGRWMRRIYAADFGPRGAVVRLPFQRVHPEFDLDVSHYGAVHARLNVPGQGTFETTESTVRIRPASAVRDELQQATGRRFFFHERTGDGRR